MTKTLLTKIVIGVLATGTVGTVGLVVASKNPVTAPVVKSIPVVGQYIDVVTFNQGLSDEEFDLIMNFDEKYYEPKSKELRAKYGIDESVSKITTAVELADIIENNPELWNRMQALQNSGEMEKMRLEGQKLEHELIQRMNSKQKQQLDKKRMNGMTYDDVKGISQQLEQQIQKEQE